MEFKYVFLLVQKCWHIGIQGSSSDSWECLLMRKGFAIFKQILYPNKHLLISPLSTHFLKCPCIIILLELQLILLE